MKIYIVVLEHKNYKCLAISEKNFTTKEQAQEFINTNNNNDFNYYIKEFEI